MSLTVGSLFAGIGGFDLAAERAGLTVKWQVDIDPFCQKVLEKHWPHVKRYGDIRRVRYPAPVDIICGGFPCQDISVAGRGAGLAGKRSGLWSEMLRIVRAVRPRYVVVENVAALLARGLGTVLGDLASIGYDAEWDCIPASAVGAPHRRDRVWIVADADSERGCGRPAIFSDATNAWQSSRRAFARCWDVEPDVGRVAHGVPARVDRLRGLGNAIVPQVAEWIFRRIIEAHGEAQSLQASTK